MNKLLLALAIFTCLDGFGQGGRKSPHDTIRTADITVTYGRPYKNGRVIFGNLVKYGEVWRLGADEATTIRFEKKVKFGDVEVPAGTYTLFALVNENEWTFILNSVLGQWGAYSYEKNKDKNVARANGSVKKVERPVEQLTLQVAKKALVVQWDNVIVELPLKVD